MAVIETLTAILVCQISMLSLSKFIPNKTSRKMYNAVPFINMLVRLDIFVLNGVQIGNRKDAVLQKDRN